MSASTMIVAVLIGGGVLFFVLLPLLQRGPDAAAPIRRGGTARQNQALELLWNEKVRVLRALRDLDFDYDVGKLGDRVYEEQRVYLIRLAIAITKRIDELEGVIAAQEARVEAAVAALRQAPQRR